MKIRCTLCPSVVRDTFESKWKHILRKHPDVMFSRLLPMLCNPGEVRARGVQIGQSLRDRIASQFRG